MNKKCSGDWVLVPRVPTQEMLEAGEKKACVWQDAWECGEVYRSMLAAAPQTPAPVDEEAVAADDMQRAREKFEAWLSPSWSREGDIDDEGDFVYREDWVQGAWIGYSAALAKQTASVDEASIYWRAMYRLQTAMRYMNNNPKLTLARAFKMADEDVARLTATLVGQEDQQ